MTKISDYIHRFLPELPDRIIYAGIFGMLFFVVGGYGPQFYYRYIDKTEYIHYQGQVTFDKGAYKPCETQYATSTIVAKIDSPIRVQSRLYKVADKPGSLVVAKEYDIQSFFKANPGDSITAKAQVPCDLMPGIYFYRGVLSYQIKGITKTTAFSSENFEVKQ